MKQMAAALQYLQEHNLMDYDELSASTERRWIAFILWPGSCGTREAALSHTVRLMGATVDYARRGLYLTATRRR